MDRCVDRRGGAEPDTGEGLALEAPWTEAAAAQRVQGTPTCPIAGSEPGGREGGSSGPPAAPWAGSGTDRGVAARTAAPSRVNATQEAESGLWPEQAQHSLDAQRPFTGLRKA